MPSDCVIRFSGRKRNYIWSKTGLFSKKYCKYERFTIGLQLNADFLLVIFFLPTTSFSTCSFKHLKKDLLWNATLVNNFIKIFWTVGRAEKFLGGISILLDFASKVAFFNLNFCPFLCHLDQHKVPNNVIYFFLKTICPVSTKFNIFSIRNIILL